MTRRVDRLVLGERLQFSTRARTRTEHRQRLALIEKLMRQGRETTVRALATGEVTWAAVIEADTAGRLGAVLGDLKLELTLEEAIELAFPRTSATTTRYRRSLAKLQARQIGLRLRHLLALPWEVWSTDRQTWPSGTDWNHLRRAVSRLLSVHLTKQHPIRAEVMARIPILPERRREPGATVADLVRLFEALPRNPRRAARYLLVTGVRIGEYTRAQPAHLGAYRLTVLQTKPRRLERSFPIDPRAWPLVVDGIPSPVSESYLRDALTEACRAVGLAHLTPHSFRHLAAQLAARAGIVEPAVRSWLGHAPGNVTRGYMAQAWTPEDAAAFAAQLGPILPPLEVLPLLRAAQQKEG